MKRITGFVLISIILICIYACGNNASKEAKQQMPEDFSFSMVWGVYGISSYDSESGELIKTRDASDVGEYTAYVNLGEDDLQKVYQWLFSDIDITKYPNQYDPFNDPDSDIGLASEPNQTIVISVNADGSAKSVRCDSIPLAPIDDCYCEEAREFMTVEKRIEELLTSLPEWDAFPDYEFFYD